MNVVPGCRGRIGGYNLPRLDWLCIWSFRPSSAAISTARTRVRAALVARAVIASSREIELAAVLLEGCNPRLRSSQLVQHGPRTRFAKTEFAGDSPLERNGFELSVPGESPGFYLRTLQVEGERERGSESRTRLRGVGNFQGHAVFFAKGARVHPLGPIRQPIPAARTANSLDV
jgi:hypothetical protein